MSFKLPAQPSLGFRDPIMGWGGRMDQTGVPNPAPSPNPSFPARQKPFRNLLITAVRGEKDSSCAGTIRSPRLRSGEEKGANRPSGEIWIASPRAGELAIQRGRSPPVIKLDVFEKPRHAAVSSR